MSTPFATEYIVSGLPLDHIDAELFWLKVQWRGRRREPWSGPGCGEWAVTMRDSWCLNDQDQWELEPQPSARTPTWCDHHRFTLEEATKRAEAMLHTVTVNGRFVDVDGRLSLR